MPWRRALTLALALTLIVAGVSSASQTIRLTTAELRDASVVIVRGHVVAIDSAWDPDGGAIYTYVVVDVAEALKGDVPARITLKQLGGTVADMALAIGGQAEFARGEEVLLFLGLRPRDNTLETSTLWQGKWTILRDVDGDAPQAFRIAGRADDGASIGREQVALADLEVEARAQSPAARVAPVDIVFTPAEAPRPGSTPGDRAQQKIPLIGWSWHEAFEGGKIDVHFAKAKQPGVGTGKKQIAAAWDRWNDVGGAIPFFKKGKKYKAGPDGTEVRDPSCPGDVVVFNQDPNREIDDSGGILAVGGTYFFTEIAIRKLNRACNGFVVTNDSAAAISFMRNKTCYTNVMAHEVGHVAGLGHSNKAGNLMFPEVSEEQCNAPYELNKDDTKFYKKIYKTKFLAR